MKPSVEQFEGVKNQFVIRTEKGRYFQSYNSMIVFIPNDNTPIQLDKKYYDYSVTTSKYRNKFLNCTSKEIEKGIKFGTYILTDLNTNN